MTKYIITMGLPGSGKSTWVKNNIKTDNGLNCVIDLDYELKPNYSKHSNILEVLTDRNILHRFINKDIVVIDGLFTTNSQILLAIKTLDIKPPNIVEIHYWKENREQCIINDKYRRELSSKSLIENSPYEELDIDLIDKNTILCVYKVEHEVFKKPDWKLHSEEENIYLDSNGYLVSNRWVLGGSWGDCWGNSGSLVGEVPTQFDALDNYLEIVYPNITYLQYKKLFSEFVEVCNDTEYGYYGGYEEYAYYKCNFKGLYDFLVEKGLIKI